MLIDPLTDVHGDTYPVLPPATWHVLSQGQIGATMPLPCPMTEAAAFDAAAAAIAAGRRVRVEKIQRNPQTGGALSICDVTTILLMERDLMDNDDATTLADHPAPRHEPDRRAEAAALAEVLREVARIEHLEKLRRRRCDTDLSSLQGGAVLRRWLGLDSILTRVLRAMRIGGAA
jgi:hypothetical protein